MDNAARRRSEQGMRSARNREHRGWVACRARLTIPSRPAPGLKKGKRRDGPFRPAPIDDARPEQTSVAVNLGSRMMKRDNKSAPVSVSCAPDRRGITHYSQAAALYPVNLKARSFIPESTAVRGYLGAFNPLASRW
jgi:hypothetical protein